MPDSPRRPSRAGEPRRPVPVLSRRTLLQLGGGLVAAGALAACTDDSTPGPTATPTTTVDADGVWSATGTMAFPAGFVWGAATSAFQVEGSTRVDGRGVSSWDTFCATPGKIDDGSVADPAADHYRLWESDLDLMADLGLPSYRFSVAWPRVLPEGTGAVNQRGLDFYRRLVDGLLARDIHPAITLYHWDLPQPLQDRGGWVDRDTAYRFADYAAVVLDALSDVDATWLTINEPKTTVEVAYAGTEHAPGLGDVDAGVAALHHQLLAHGLAVRAFREGGGAGRIGIALNLMPVYAGVGAEDAARRADGASNRLYLDPVLLGTYPDDAIGTKPGQLHADPAVLEALVQDGDMAIVSEPCDLLAVQYYGVGAVDKTGAWLPMYPTSIATWQQIHPEGLYETLLRITEDYPDAPPLAITENGIPDGTSMGVVHDEKRIDFLRAHLQQAARAIDEGVDLRWYYAWSLLDNFEWARGMTQRWGLVHVDYQTQVRTPKDSAHWYSGVIAANAVAPEEEPVPSAATAP